MPTRKRDVTALLGSRICHDFISPIGAIGNGLELLEMSRVAIGPELALVSESLANANARIRFYRVAYGTPGHGSEISSSEIVRLFGGLYTGSRFQIDWQPTVAMPRPVVKLVFLLVQCVETALPQGGRIVVRSESDICSIKAAGPRVTIDPELWRQLREPDDRFELSPAQVQFALVPELVRELGRNLKFESRDGEISIRV
jgi:histidine phosphotransferase ChpT